MSRVIVAILLLGLLSCTGLSQRGNADRANGRLAKQDYQGALSIAEFTISQGDAAPEAKVRAYMIKGLSLEGLGRKGEAMGVYEFIIATYPKSVEAFQAKGRLSELGGLCSPAT